MYDVAVFTRGGTDKLSSVYKAYNPTILAGVRHYAAELGVTSLGGVVSVWSDQAAGAKELSQGTAGLRPVYSPKRFGNNRIHGVIYDGVDDVMTLTGGPISFTQISIFAVVKFAGNGSFILPATGGIVGGTGPAIIDFSLDETAPFPEEAAHLRTFDADLGPNFSSPNLSRLNDGSPIVVGKTHDNGSGALKFYLNGVQIGGTQTDIFGAGRANWDRTGNVAGNPLTGEIADLVIAESVLSANDALDTMNWLFAMYVARSTKFTREATLVPWFARDGAGLLASKTTPYIFMVGGWNNTAPWAGSRVTNEIWRAPVSDLVNGWVLLHAYDSNPPTSGPTACFPPQHTAGWLMHTHNGQEYIYSIGSDIYNNQAGPVPGGTGTGNSNVWRAAVLFDGSLGQWELVTTTALFGPIVLHMVASFQNSIFVMGGQTNIADNNTASNKVFRSDDGGKTWIRLADAPWPARGMVYDPVELNGLLILAGGGRYAAPRVYYSDVWAFDGTSWIRLVANAPWFPRIYGTTKVQGGKFWVINGANEPFAGPANGLGNIGDAWAAEDAKDFVQQTITSWRPSHADGACTLPDDSKIIIGPGNGNISQGPVHPVEGDGKIFSISQYGFVP